MKIKISEIKIKKGRRPVDEDKARELADSIREIGLLNPITVTKENQLIAGAHRIAAYKLLGKKEIEATVTDISGLKAKLAEIDENLIRKELDDIAIGELAIQRDEILEQLGLRAKQGDNRFTDRGEIISPLKTTAAMASDIGISERTLQQNKQLARNLTPEVKEIVRKYGIPKNDALKLTRIDDEEKQLKAAEDITRLLSAEQRGVETTVALRRISEYRKTGVKPKDWVDGADDQLNAEIGDLDAYFKELADKKNAEAEYKDDPFPGQFKAYLDSLDSDVHKIVVCNSVMRICKQTLAALQRAEAAEAAV